jgi:hypothetical protein
LVAAQREERRAWSLYREAEAAYVDATRRRMEIEREIEVQRVRAVVETPVSRLPGLKREAC